MKNKTTKLFKALDQYIVLQEKHINDLKNIKNPNLSKQNFERSKSFEDIKPMIRKLSNCTKQKEIDIILACNNKLQIILEKNNKLSEIIKKYRDNIYSEMKRFRKNKQAIINYGLMAQG